MTEKTLLASLFFFYSCSDFLYVRRFLRNCRWVLIGAPVAFYAGCASTPSRAPPTVNANQARRFITAALPQGLHDPRGWTDDIYAAFEVQSIDPTPENICAALAVIAQESSFQVDPVVPGLPAVAWREIAARAKSAGVPLLLVRGALQISSPTSKTYSARIDAAKTEKDLSDIFEDFIGTVPMGRTLFAEHNPVRTRGPMQVNVAFAEQYAAARPYPYPVKISVSEEVFSRRGSIYFGIGHLLAYKAPYDQYLYRFADFNAGQFASRNAAFQRALSRMTGVRLTADGALLPHEAQASLPGATESAARSIRTRLKLDDSEIHDALAQSKQANFERTSLYRQVFAFADELQTPPASRAAVPSIILRGPKLARHLSTEWYARRVNERFQRCLRHSKI